MPIVNEANVSFIVPEHEKVTSRNEVFYNPAMSFNRDISLLYLLQKSRDLSILCGMAGTGVRAIRYSNSGFLNVTANDLNPRAYELITKNAKMNGSNLSASRMDFNLLEGKYDLIDIDPFGSPVRYIHPAFRLMRKEGMLHVTATDTAALCGSSRNACVRKYSAYPLSTSYCHEIGLRILIGYVARQAASWDYGIHPVVSFYKDHYMRTHIELEKGKRKADRSMASLGFLHHCDKCLNRYWSNRSECACDCGNKLRRAYPVWGGEINDIAVLSRMKGDIIDAPLNDKNVVSSFLDVLIDEVQVPFFWDSHELFSHLKIPVPPMDRILEKVSEEGFMVSRTHYKPTAFKTNADNKELFQIFS